MLTVVTQAESYDLATLEEVKAYLGIAGTGDDANLGVQITAASMTIQHYCRRVLVVETVRETLRSPAQVTGMICLERYPINSVVSVDEDGSTLTTDDYECDTRKGVITRLSSDVVNCWGEKVVIEYVTGLAAIPVDLKMAVYLTVKAMRESGERDSGVKSERLEGYAQISYFSVTQEGLPEEVKGMLARFMDGAL